MKMKHINKILASALSVSMLMGGTLPVLAADGEVDAPIYSFDVVDVIVPTTYAVAFNPQGLTVKVDDTGTTKTDQILSKNYGIINKSTSDKVITVKLTVEDQNTDSSIIFVNSAQDVEDAEDGEFKIHLTAVPAAASTGADDKVKVGGNEADQNTTATALSDVTMPGANDKAVTMMSGDNYIGFKLDKATWGLKDGKDVTLGETTGNNVADSFEVKSLAADGAGITAFTFGGTMNANAKWSDLTKGIKISVVYSNDTASSDLSVISDTDAMVELDMAPVFTTGKGVGQINYFAGVGKSGVSEIKKVEVPNAGKVYDGYNANGAVWPAATNENGVITLPSKFLGYLTVDAVEATVTYVTNGGETTTAKVDIKVKIVSEAPTFTTGSGIGQINYTMGVGDDGLKAIKKIEVTNAGTAYDGYNANGSTWPAATDENGVITLSSKFLGYLTTNTAEATVTYETNKGETRTFTVTVKVK